MAQLFALDSALAISLSDASLKEAKADSQGDAMVGLDEGKTYQVILVGACTEKAKNPSTGETLSFACERILAHDVKGGDWFLSTTGITPYAKAGYPSAKSRQEARFRVAFSLSFDKEKKTDKKVWDVEVDGLLTDEQSGRLKAKFGV